MDKIYQVFVSSTYQDLQEERKEVMQALLELDCMPAGMELFPASNDDQWTLIKRVIDTCDYYLLIIGGRYGSVSDTGISYTQMEFEYALEMGKPIISFLPKHPEQIAVGKCETDVEKKEKLEKFKALAQKKLVKYWDTPENLGSVVSRSMIKLIKDFPAEGWVKAGNVIDETAVREIAKLQRENEELKEQLKIVATQAPKGSESFAQGEDWVAVSYDFCAEKGDDFLSETYECNHVDSFTWNALFAYVAPKMIDECTDYAFKTALDDFVEHNSTWNQQEVFLELRRANSFSITQESFNLIKVQFRALGLICAGEKKRSTTDKHTYWKLTAYGDYIMTTLLAVKRN